MKSITFSNMAGLLLMGLGMTVMGGWWIGSVNLLTIFPGHTQMVFNTAFCFFLSGVSLIFADHPAYLMQKINFFLSLGIVFFSAFVLSQNIFRYTSGIDQWLLKVQIFDANPFPGRMGNSSAVAFILSGIILFLLPYAHRKFNAILIQIAIYGVLTIGLTATLGYLLNVEVLYNWYNSTFLAVHSACGIAILGLGLRSLWNRHQQYQALYNGHEDKKILVVSGIIVSCVCLLVGTIIFTVLSHAANIANRYALLEQVFPLVTLTVMVGMVLLYWQILPLVRHAIVSERELFKTNQRLQESENRLSALAYQDHLTGLANRSRLEQFINHSINVSRRNQKGFAVVFMDLDHFKNINDTIGHEAGDQLLKVVAERLQAAVRTTDLVTRLGGDEFVLVVTDVKHMDAVAVIAEKILLLLKNPIVIGGHELYITMSIGISLYPQDGDNIHTLLQDADLALYRAKEQGRNNYQFCTPEMTARAQEKMARQSAVSLALHKKEFMLYYQPKFNLLQRRIVGLEALIRWKNPNYNTVSPREIISLAEETGLIVPLSEWILKASCQQTKTWQVLLGNDALNVAVNISRRQFKSANFIEDIKKIIEDNGIQPNALEMEITENNLMKEPEYALKTLTQLKAIGVQIVIDNFGTGLFSLNALRKFPIDKIKIDGLFVHQLHVDDTASEVISAIIVMANKLNIKTVAEGVETREQFEFLLREGCCEMQGYYLGQPLPPEEMERFLLHPISQSHLMRDIFQNRLYE